MAHVIADLIRPFIKTRTMKNQVLHSDSLPSPCKERIALNSNEKKDVDLCIKQRQAQTDKEWQAREWLNQKHMLKQKMNLLINPRQEN